MKSFPCEPNTEDLVGQVKPRKGNVGGSGMFDKKVRYLRGYRPSQFSVPDEEEVERGAQVVRLANVEFYAKRARKGLPLFRDTDKLPSALKNTPPPPDA